MKCGLRIVDCGLTLDFQLNGLLKDMNEQNNIKKDKSAIRN